MISYLQAVDVIRTFAINHLQIQRFGFEFREQMPNLATISEGFPYLFVVPVGSASLQNVREIDFDVYCVDRYQKGRANVPYVISDTDLILADLSLWLEEGQNDIEVVRSYPTTPINNDLLDYVGGHVMRLRVQVDRIALCEIPFDGDAPVPPSCPSGFVRNSDNTFTEIVPSGSTITLPDITVTDSDGSTYTQPAVTDVVCTLAPPCEDATYEVEYLNGTPIESGSIPSGGFQLIQVPNPIVCADAVVNVNSVFFDNVASGGTLNIEVRKSSGSDLVGSKQGQYWRIGDSTAVLKTSGGATISTTSIRAEESEDITAPDATIENSNASYTDSVVSGGTLVLPDITVTDSDGSTYTQPSVENVVCTLSPDTDLEVNGTLEGTFAAGSTIEVNVTDGVNPVTPNDVTVVGDVVTIEVPSGGGGGWQRPSDWLTMPTVTSAQDTFVGLHAVFPSGNNFAAFRFTTSTGQYQVDWGDGVVDLVNSNIVAEHTYDYSTYDPTNATLSTRGYKQAIITVTPVSGNLLSCNFQLRRTTVPAQNQGYATGFLDCILSMPNINVSNGIIFGGGTVRHSYCEQFEIKNSGGCLTLNDTFFNCFSLKSIPFLDTVGITSMNQMFLNCLSLQTVPLFDTSSVTNMAGMFGSCTSLQTLPLFNTSSVTNMGSIFSGCTSLQTLPLFNTSSVTNMAGMFGSCTSLQSVPLFNTSNVTNMASMFNLCRSINEIPAFNTTLVTSQVDNFAGCFSLDRTDIICRVSVNFINCQLSQAELVNIFNNLLDRTLLTPANINISGNWGATALTVGERAIAIGKNWTITG